MKSGRFHFPSSNNGSELQDPAALDNGSADAQKIGLLLYASDRAFAFKLIFVQALFGAELP